MRNLILVTGGSGKLGRELLKIYPEAYAPTHEEMDITDPLSVNRVMEAAKPKILIHTAALTSIRECELFQNKAWLVNVEGTGNMVESCLRHCPGTFFVYISTACIFSGEKGSYNESSIPSPKNYYGLSKLWGECLPRILPKWLVIRTNFMAKEPYPYPKAFVDRVSNYLWASDVAGATKELIESPLGMTRVVHVTGDKTYSMFEMARKCPNSDGVQPLTLKVYYEEPDAPKLTRDMRLKTVKWHPYSLGYSLR